MIFVTVGSQEAFDRMIRAVDEWAAQRGRRDVFAQIAAGAYRPKHIEFTDFMEPAEFKQRVSEASVIVAHAGMGTILTALEFGKPIVVLPRREHLRETRSDHQHATSKQFGAQGRVIVAENETELHAKLDAADSLAANERISAEASPQLMATIRAFLNGDPQPLKNAAPKDPSSKPPTHMRSSRNTLPEEA
ncbi:MAG: glycosyltransferase [Terriglobales bacterium]